MPKDVLDLDVGNSMTKWRLHSGDHRLTVGIYPNFDIDNYLGIMGGNISRVRISSVSNVDYEKKLADLIHKKTGCMPEFASAVKYCSGVLNGYDIPEELGTDRWLAALAAWSMSDGRACLILDAGTAFTLDTVTPEGVYLGGYIIPGYTMMQEMLVSKADKIRCATDRIFPADFTVVPANSASAVKKGAAFALCAIARTAIDEFEGKWADGAVYLTGGNGRDIAAQIGRISRYFPDLVLDGLSLALP